MDIKKLKEEIDLILSLKDGESIAEYIINKDNKLKSKVSFLEGKLSEMIKELESLIRTHDIVSDSLKDKYKLYVEIQEARVKECQDIIEILKK